MLTDLQRRVRRVISQLPEAGVFALAGGAALIVRGVVQRVTNDLDFFAPHPQSLERLVEAACAALRDDGLAVTVVKSAPSFARLQVDSSTDSTAVDFATDYRLMPEVATGDGPVLAEAELAADKVLALEARGAPRDYIDFAALAERFSIEELCDLAAQKDLGFRPENLARTLDRFDQLEPQVFGMGTDNYSRLQEAVHSASGQLDEVISQDRPDRNIADPRDGLELGL